MQEAVAQSGTTSQARSAWCQLWLPSPPAMTATKELLLLSSAGNSCPTKTEGARSTRTTSARSRTLGQADGPMTGSGPLSNPVAGQWIQGTAVAEDTGGELVCIASARPG